MIRQVFILFQDQILYQRIFSRGLNNSELIEKYIKIKEEISPESGEGIDSIDTIKYRITFSYNKNIDLYIIFVSDLNDDFFSVIRPEIYKVEEIIPKKQFEDYKCYCERFEQKKSEFDERLDDMNRTVKAKICLIGYSGVGKTTIKKLIKLDEIPLEHIPTINADIATIRIGKLYFFLWDFAGQMHYEFLWKKMLHGSNAVLIVTDSSLKNVEKSKFFIKLAKETTPHARMAVIGNKQDLPESLKPNQIEEILGVKTYPMIANISENREKMIKIIVDLLDINLEKSVLLEPLAEREKLVKKAQIMMKNGLYEKTVEIYERIIHLCRNELDDYELGEEYSIKCEKLKNFLKGLKSLS
ncbi:MAG: GTP-binding protein [Candidatus Lokiarchaeota archaeon]|nr:GTP-binding protein [Candidatus Lokiarchaeota archaeon]MBD3202168.1 GTP-binding protein [Candidatus Lokiarchaeota archaeon]